METKDLEFALKLAQPCLLGVDFIPILSHYCFIDGLVYAYDDVSAIVVPCTTELECAVRGDMLLGLVGLAAAQITVEQAKDKVVVVSGDSRAELPCLPSKNFLFKFPEQEAHTTFSLTEELMRGLALCAASVGKDPRRPEFTGVTLQLGKAAAMYASDNTSLTRYILTEGVGKKALTVILPKSVCDQILGTATALEAKPETVHVSLTPEFVLVEFAGDGGDARATIVGKLLTVKPADFEKAIEASESTHPEFSLPEEFDKAVAKVVLVIGKELEKTCLLQTEGSALWVRGQGSLGKAETKFVTDQKKLPSVTAVCSPEHITKMLADVTTVVVDEKAVRMRGERLTYYVATRG